MFNVKTNYSNYHKNNLNCSIFGKEAKKRKDTQKHIWKCPVIRREISDNNEVKYQNVKSESFVDQIKVVKSVRRNL